MIGDHYPALLRARRRRERWSEEDRRLYPRHRWRSEGFHGEAKSWYGPGRAIRSGLANMKIQDYLTAAAINLKRLAAAFFTFVMSLILAGARRGGDEKAVLLSQRHASVVPTQRPDNPTAKSDFFDGSEIDYT